MSSCDIPSLLILEYEQLKEEQRLRISTRDNLVYATIGAMALIVGAALQSDSKLFLLLVPLVCLTLGWTYVANDDRITAIGSYIRDVLGPGLTDLSSAEIELFAWERRHREDGGRLLRKACQLAVDLLLFCVTAITALFIAWRTPGVPAVGQVTMAAELTAVTALAMRFVTMAR